MFTGFDPNLRSYSSATYTAVGGETTIPLSIYPDSFVIRNGVMLYPWVNFSRDPLTGNVILIDPTSANAGDTFFVANFTSFSAANTYTKAEMDSRLIPVGAIMAFAHGTPDAGWLECDGGLESQATWPTLFSKIGQNFRKVRTEIDSYLPLNGNGIDVSTYRDKTTIKGTSASYVTATGKFGATKVFQGSTTGGLLTRVGSSFNRSAWTIEGYWKAGSAAGTTRHIFMLGDAWAGLSGFSVSVWTDNKVYCYLNTNTALGTSTLTLSDQNLHHIAASYDGTTYRIFIDGVLYISVAAAAIPSTYNGNLALNWTYGADTTYQRASQYSHWLVTSGVTKYTSAFTPPTVAWDILETIPDGQFRKPDLRGESLRGWDHGRGVDSFGLRTIGSWQEDSFQGHFHENYYYTSSTGGSGLTVSASGSAGSGQATNSYTKVYEPSSDGQHGNPRFDSETRPRNVAVMFCIKAADIVTDPALLSSAALDDRLSKIEAGAASYSFRNKIINGKMEIAQRGTSFTAAAGTYYIDRWASGVISTAAVVNISQSSDAPTPFKYSLRATVNTADASVAASGMFNLMQAIEGYNIIDLVGRTFTISFYVRSSKTGTHCISLGNNGVDRSYVAEYTINVANAWEYKTITVVDGLPTSGTWNYTNGSGLALRFCLLAGSSFQGPANVWNISNVNASSGQVNVLDTVGNIFAITGVQVEAGTVATPFEHRPYGAELTLCQRYYEKSYLQSVVPGTNINADTSAAPGMAVWGSGAATASQYGMANYGVVKRASPTLTIYCSTGVSGKLSSSIGQVAGTVGAVSDTSTYVSSVSAATWFGMHWVAEAEI